MNDNDKNGSTGFNAQDPFQNLEMHREGLLPPPPIVRIEGWQYFVHKPSAVRPEMPSAKVFAAMSSVAKKTFAKQRKKFHSEMPLLETSAFSSIHSETIRLAVMNYTAAPGARMGVVLDGLGTVGKSSIAMELGKKYELSWRKNILPKIQGENFSRPIPVVYITLPGMLAIKDFNRLITSFMGISVHSGAGVPWLNDRIIDAMQQCGTSLVIVDDIHFLQMKNRSSQVINNHLKHLASCVSATFVYAGINVEGSGLLAEGNSKQNAFVSQTQHRFKAFPITPYTKNSAEFKALLSSFEACLALMNQPLGSLVQMSDFIHDRTGGFMGAISNLLREGANIAIEDGKEQLTRSILGKVKLAFASEAHQKSTTSKE